MYDFVDSDTFLNVRNVMPRQLFHRDPLGRSVFINDNGQYK